MPRWILSMSLVLALALAPPASASERALQDPDEPGAQMALDVAGIAHGHEEAGRRNLIRHSVTFHEAVSSDQLVQGFGGVELFFNVDRDPEEERVLRFLPNPDGSVSAAVYSRGGTLRGFAGWWRPDDKTVTVVFRKSLLKRHLTAYRWSVTATQDAPCDPPHPDGPIADGCWDETGTIKHRL